MNEKYNLPDDAVKAFRNVIEDIKRNRITVTSQKSFNSKRTFKDWDFKTKWNHSDVQRAANFIISLPDNDALAFWRYVGAGSAACDNIPKLHVAFSSEGKQVKDHLVEILTKD